MFMYRFVFLATLTAAIPWVWFTFWPETFNMYAALFIIFVILSLESLFSEM